MKHGPNPSIEGTSNIWLRQLSAAPHVKRYASQAAATRVQPGGGQRHVTSVY